MDFIENCRNLISIDTTAANGNLEAARFVAKLCGEKGLHTEIHEEFLGDLPQANVIARTSAGRKDAEFLLQTHLDTVDPGPFHLWNHTSQNPFDAHIIDGKIYGLGAADVKLDFLCKLEALSEFAQRKEFKMAPVLVATYGEESGMQGAMKLIRKNQISAKMALIGEPSNLQIIHAAKGYAAVEIRIPFSQEEVQYRQEHDLLESASTQSKMFSGKSVHSSVPHLGESAIRKMMDYLLMMPDHVAIMEMEGGNNFNQVPAHALLEIDVVSNLTNPIIQKIGKIYRAILQLEQEFQIYNDPKFIPATPTLNIGTVKTFQDHILMSGTCRMSPMINQSIYEKWMKYLGDECEKVGSSFRVVDYKRPFRTDEGSILLKGCQQELRAMGLNDGIITQPSSNEASIFSRLQMECLCFGAGIREGNMHTPDEHVSIEDLMKAVDFYKRVISRFCI